MKYREGSNGENQQNLKFALWNINKIDKSSAWLRQIDDQILKSGVKEEVWLLALQKQKGIIRNTMNSCMPKIRLPRGNGKIVRKTQTTESNSRINENPSWLNNKETELVNKNFPQRNAQNYVE